MGEHEQAYNVVACRVETGIWPLVDASDVCVTSLCQVICSTGSESACTDDQDLLVFLCHCECAKMCLEWSQEFTVSVEMFCLPIYKPHRRLVARGGSARRLYLPQSVEEPAENGNILKLLSTAC